MAYPPLDPWVRRRQRRHGPPAWVRLEGCYLITVCARVRHVNALAHPGVAPVIWRTLSNYDHRAAWRLDTVVVMPDHVHLLVVVPVTTDLRRTVIDWKRFVARHHGVRWQRDFSEYRLRATDSIPERRQYLRRNPQAAGLVEDPGDWPWFWAGPSSPR